MCMLKFTIFTSAVLIFTTSNCDRQLTHKCETGDNHHVLLNITIALARRKPKKTTEGEGGSAKGSYLHADQTYPVSSTGD